MRFEQFSDKHKNLNLERKELERKWRLKLEEEMLLEAISQKSKGSANAPGVGGGGGNDTSVSSQLMMIYEKDASTYTYYVYNYNTNSINGPHDSGISVEDYPMDYSGQYLINNGGYCHRFYNPGNNDYILLFIGATGNIIDTITGNTVDLSVNTYDGRYIVAWDYDEQIIWIFDGNKVTTDTTTFANVGSYGSSSNWNSTSSDGFLMESTTEEESGDIIKKLYLGTINGITEIYSVTIPSGSGILYNFYGSSFSDKYIIQKYNTVFLLGFTVIDSTGAVIQDVVLGNEIYRNMQLQRFGTNKFYAIFYDDTNAEIDYEIYVYDGTNNSLLHKTLVYGNSYTNIYMVYDVRNVWNFSDYNFSENVMFTFYNSTGTTYGLTEVDYCKLIGFFEGESDFVEYDFADEETKYIGFTSIKTSETFLLPSDEAGQFSFLVFNKNSTTSFATPTSSGDQESINDTSAGSKCFLRYLDINSGFYYFYMVSTDGSEFVLLDEEILERSTTLEFDTVIVRDTANELAWYFNSISTNWTSTDYFFNYNLPTSYSNNTYLSNGTIIGYSVSGTKIYTRTSVVDVSLNNYENLDLGKDIFALWYYDSERENKITLKLYNYAGTLLQTLETEDEDMNDFNVVANRVYFSTYTKYFDGDVYYIKNFHHITASKKTTITKTLPDTTNLYYIINDWVWWD